MAGNMVVCKQTWCWRRRELRVIHLNPLAKGREPTWASEISKSAPTMTHFLQQGHTCSNKVTPPNSATPYSQLFKHTSMRAIFIQTIIEGNLSAWLFSKITIASSIWGSMTSPAMGFWPILLWNRPQPVRKQIVTTVMPLLCPCA